jgi:hypothetical protein
VSRSDEPTVTFTLYGVAIDMDPDQARQMMAGLDRHDLGEEKVRELLDQAVATVFPEGFSVEAWEALDRETRASFMLIVLQALSQGIESHPPRH